MTIDNQNQTNFDFIENIYSSHSDYHELIGFCYRTIQQFKMSKILTPDEVLNESAYQAIKFLKKGKAIENQKAFLKTIIFRYVRWQNKHYYHVASSEYDENQISYDLVFESHLDRIANIDLLDRIFKELSEEECQLMRYYTSNSKITWQQIANDLDSGLNATSAKKRGQRLREKIKKNHQEEYDSI
jgi:hypothetical protein